MVNSELFRKIADQIEKEPESYNQKYVAREPGVFGGCIFCHAEEIMGLPHYNFSISEDYYVPGQESVIAMGLDIEDASALFHPRWKPREGLTVPQALRMIADGATVSEVSA